MGERKRISFSSLVRSRWSLPATFIVFFLFWASSPQGPNFSLEQFGLSHDADNPKNVPSIDDGCAKSLLSQQELLISEFQKLLAGVTHVAIIGFPDHSNKGDSAIWSGEIILLGALNIEVAYITADHETYDEKIMRESLESFGGPKKTAILYHGGGNFGDIWYIHQRLREKIALSFKDYRIRSFPQTYSFKDEKKKKRAQNNFAQHPDLQLTVRDTRSYTDVQHDFGGKHEVILLPDAATMLFRHEPSPGGNEMSGADFVFLARNDHEGGQNHAKEKATIYELQHVIDRSGKSTDATVELMDWIKKDPEGVKRANYNTRADLRTQWAYDFLTQGGLILSDRLHVHILSTIWGVDHITVEEGKYAKLRTYHDTWLLQCEKPNSMAHSVREAVDFGKAWYKNGRSFY